MAKCVSKKCDICRHESNEGVDVLLYGDWMHSHGITVHYYCLLLSTNLPQRGKDDAGILGFQVRDIRKEIRSASDRRCQYCAKSYASIRCHKCQLYFHLPCGRRNYCQFQFCDEFRSYCHKCTPLDKLQQKWSSTMSTSNSLCYICQESMGLYNATKWIHAACCGAGFVHSTCMQEYALSAGYYLRCLWCADTSFRDHVRMHGIFVPDRDAQWERQRNAFRELHRGHQRCDMANCQCPRGRDYVTAKWSIILCGLCGSMGAHNPRCVPGRGKSTIPVKTFKCDTCAAIEHSNEKRIPGLHDTTMSDTDANTSLMVYKCTEAIALTTEDENTSSASSCITVMGRPLTSSKIVTFSSPDKRQSKNVNEMPLCSEDNVIILLSSPETPASSTQAYSIVQQTKVTQSNKRQHSLVMSTEMESAEIACQAPKRSCFEENTSSISTLENSQPSITKDSMISQPMTNDDPCSLPDEDAEPCEKLGSSVPRPDTPIPTAMSEERQSNTVPSPKAQMSRKPKTPKLKSIKEFDLFEFTNDKRCLGTCRVRINISEPRFKDIDPNALDSFATLLRPEDIVQRWPNDDGIFNAISNLICKIESEEQTCHKQCNNLIEANNTDYNFPMDELSTLSSLPINEERNVPMEEEVKEKPNENERDTQKIELTQLSKLMHDMWAQQSSHVPPKTSDYSRSQNIIPTQTEPMLEYTPSTLEVPHESQISLHRQQEPIAPVSTEPIHMRKQAHQLAEQSISDTEMLPEDDDNAISSDDAQAC